MGAEPTTNTVPARAEQARIAVGIFDGFVHRDDVPQAHLFQLLVRERVADQAGDLPMRLEPAFLVGGRTNLLRDTVAVADRLPRAYHDVVGDATRRRFACATQHLTCMVVDSPTATLEVLFPLFASEAIRGEREVDVTFVIDGPRDGCRGSRNDGSFTSRFGIGFPERRGKVAKRCSEIRRELLVRTTIPQLNGPNRNLPSRETSLDFLC